MSDLDPILQADELLQRDAPALWAALSPLGRRLRQPASFLPLQSAEARGKPFNATIGQITDGKGRAVPLPAMAAVLADLDPAEASQALLYSSVEGLAALRRDFRAWQRRGVAEEVPSTLPLVTDGIFHSRGLAFQLFVPPGRTVISSLPDADSTLRELVEIRLEGRLFELAGGGALPRDLEGALAGLGEGEPALVLLATTGEGGGESGQPEDRSALVELLVGRAARNPLVVAVDDRWEPLAAPSSPFWNLAGRTASLVPIKLDGSEGSWRFPGGRVGFLTFAYPPESGVARAVESKVKMLLRAEVGSPSSFTQTLFHHMLVERVNQRLES